MLLDGAGIKCAEMGKIIGGLNMDRGARSVNVDGLPDGTFDCCGK